MIGLTPTNFGTQAQTIPFAFALQPGGIAEIRESGVYRAETAFVPGDVLRIAVKSHVVKYFKNRVLIYQSKNTSGLPMMVDTALLSASGTLKKVVVSGAQ